MASDPVITNPIKTRVWDLNTAANGDFFDDEFDQIYENFNDLAVEISDNIGQALATLGANTAPFITKSGTITKGAGDSLDITEHSVVVERADGTQLIRLTIPLQDDLAIPSAVLDNATTNFIKVAHQNAAPFFVITVDDTAPTTKEAQLDTFVGPGGGPYVFSSTKSPIIDIQSVNEDIQIINDDIQTINDDIQTINENLPKILQFTQSILFTSSTTWVPPVDIFKAQFIVKGGGGEGGEGNTVSTSGKMIAVSGGGGGEGEQREGFFSIVPSVGISITIGAGGTGGANNPGNPTTVGTPINITANGGLGGLDGLFAEFGGDIAGGVGGAGGTGGSGGQADIPGQSGGVGFVNKDDDFGLAPAVPVVAGGYGGGQNGGRTGAGNGQAGSLGGGGQGQDNGVNASVNGGNGFVRVWF